MANKKRVIAVRFCLFTMKDLDDNETYLSKTTTVRKMSRAQFAEILAYGSQAIIKKDEDEYYQVVKVDLAPIENYVLSLPEIHMLRVNAATTKTHNYRRATAPLWLLDLFKDKNNE